MTISLLRASVTDWWFLNHIDNAYVTDWWFLNHIDNAARIDTIGKPYPVKRALDNIGLRAVNRHMSSWPALGSGAAGDGNVGLR
ncbi:hypothetical protein PIB30_037807 [Stylosanthes scabra]|uniref:Uncharacterized protein n=1 Tax=Stylosanthes scabra TaxID=79078 RepID=A0ABU6QDA0_9FABA|nr:hypothetical protein [Stylosanthes scabra]